MRIQPQSSHKGGRTDTQAIACKSTHIMHTLTIMQLFLLKKKLRDSEMIQWIKALATRPGDLSLIPETYMVEGEK